MTKKILFINSFCGVGSTGRICIDLARKYEEFGYEVKIAHGRDPVPEQYSHYAVRIGTKTDYMCHALYARVADGCGFGSKRATQKFLLWAEAYNPDVVWLHNLHGYYINIEMLFAWIKSRPQMEVKWTLHDCWPFTGHCAYFSAVGCEQWKDCCLECKQLRKYPICYTKGNVRNNYFKKRNAFTGVKNLTLITPSKWLADLVKNSYLGEYQVEVIHNEINRGVFKPTPSDFRQRFGLENRIIVLGVAGDWDERKGLNDFCKLANMLDDRFVIVLVGLSRKQIKSLPKKIKGIEQTDSPSSLAGVFTAADLLGDPSFKETFEIAPVEAQACETQSGVYEDTACEEITEINGSFLIPRDVKAIYEVLTHNTWRGRESKVFKIICFEKTNSPNELAQIYTCADYFINPTYEDNYPTVNLEAIACGTKVITYNTGGCRETLYSAVLEG